MLRACVFAVLAKLVFRDVAAPVIASNNKCS